MKAIASLCLGLSCALAAPSFATSPALPRPVVADSVDVGVVPYVGIGYRTEVLSFDNRHVTHLRLRMPAQCAVQLHTIVARGDNGRVHGRLVTTYNDGLYTHYIYAVNKNRGADMSEIELGLSSPFAYSTRHQCGVRVFVSGDYAIPYVK